MNTSAPHDGLTSFIWKFVRSQRWTFLAIALLSLVWSLDAALWPYIFRLAIDALTHYDTDRAAVWVALSLPVACGACLWITIEVGFRCMGFLLARALPKLDSDIRMAMFDHIQHHSPKYFNEHFSGSLANKITDMTTQVSSILQLLLTMFIPTFVACLMSVLLFIFVNPLFGMSLIGLIISHFTICILFTKKCSSVEELHGEVRSSLLGKIVDSLTNNFAVNLFYRFNHEKSLVALLQKQERQRNHEAKKQVEIMRIFLGASYFVIGGLITNSLLIHLWIKGKLSTGEFAQIFNTSWNISMILWLSGSAIPGLFQSIGIAKQALSLMHDPQDLADIPEASSLVVSRGEIIFENVSFHYGEHKLFQNKNVHIRGGEKVGLVGYSGSGKSTFINLILRFLSPEKGRILIDGQEIAKVSLESLRKQVSLIPQDPLLFHRSLKENIHYGRVDASQEEVLKAAHLTHCDEFIRRTPQGYDSLVGERGTKLSGGERQRIAIARALLAKAPILILDEATSALDSVTEKYIQEGFEKIMQKRTTIVIAHRLSTLAKMDRILVFDRGKIVEEGSHEILLARNGHYAKMWQTQAIGFLPDNPKK